MSKLGPFQIVGGATDGWMDGWTDGWTDGRMDGQDFPHCVVQDCVSFGANALLMFDTFALTPKQGKGIAVPYCFGCLLLIHPR